MTDRITASRVGWRIDAVVDRITEALDDYAGQSSPEELGPLPRQGYRSPHAVYCTCERCDAQHEPLRVARHHFGGGKTRQS